MKIKGIYILPFFIGVLALSSCYRDKADRLYPNTSACDTTSVVSYSQTLVPIFTQYCYSCHLGPSPSGGIEMGTYASDKAIAVNGKLYGSVSFSAGYFQMPNGGIKLSDCQIAKIKKWIDNSSPNN